MPPFKGGIFYGILKEVKTFIIILIFISSYQVHAARQLAMKLVGVVGTRTLTNRDVEANYLIDRVLYNEGKYTPLTTDTQEFNTTLNRLLIEWMVSEEATAFGVAKVTDQEVEQSYNDVKKKLMNTPNLRGQWNSFGLTDGQLKEMVSRKMRANRFIKYKSNSSFVQVSDEEAQSYFNKNRLKFGTMEFEQFKVSIKRFLGNKNAEDRLRDWFEILRKKHKVKNIIGSNVSHGAFSSTNQ
ncbi:MAG: hypothetical protein SGI74_01615 [Oligoflexia bacterium]|nr:hypothetical protein [Oligoflexia bacterium]